MRDAQRPPCRAAGRAHHAPLPVAACAAPFLPGAASSVRRSDSPLLSDFLLLGMDRPRAATGSTAPAQRDRSAFDDCLHGDESGNSTERTFGRDRETEHERIRCVNRASASRSRGRTGCCSAVGVCCADLETYPVRP
jgi:hypothetical protein